MSEYTIGPFSVIEQETMTECECPAQLCTHQPDGYRFEYDWIVWDNQAQEHASISRRGNNFQDFYRRKRDAVAAVHRYLLSVDATNGPQPTR